MTKDTPLLWVIKPKKIIFFGVFFMVFCFSGAFSMFSIVMGIFDYRMGLVSFLVIPLILLFGIKFDEVILAFFVLTIEIIISGIYNHSSLLDILVFMRIVLFAVLIYQLVKLYITPKTITPVIKVMIIISIIQLPFILIEKIIYPHLPASISNQVDFIDFDFGTFNFKTDSAMSFFILLIIVVLLFAPKRTYFINHKWLLLTYLSLTLLITNSSISIVLLILIWLVYFIKNFSLKTFVSFILMAAVTLGLLYIFGSLNGLISKVVQNIQTNTNTSLASELNYFSGSYGRGAALSYFLSNDILWLGDGPSKYFDAINRISILGNAGHFFTFYTEVGLLGWLLSLLIFFLICFPKYNGRRKITMVGLLAFFSITALGFTTQVLNDISIVLASCIISKIELIPYKTELAQKVLHNTLE